jgi:peptidyl-tRNA hydrolase
MQSLAFGKFQAQARHRVGFVLVDAITAKQQKVDARAEMRAFEKKRRLPQLRSASTFC